MSSTKAEWKACLPLPRRMRIALLLQLDPCCMWRSSSLLWGVCMCDKQLHHWGAALPAILHIWLWCRRSTSTNGSVALKWMFHVVCKSKTQLSPLPQLLPMNGRRCVVDYINHTAFNRKPHPSVNWVFWVVGELMSQRSTFTSFSCHSYISKRSGLNGFLPVRAFLFRGKWIASGDL